MSLPRQAWDFVVGISKLGGSRSLLNKRLPTRPVAFELSLSLPIILRPLFLPRPRAHSSRSVSSKQLL